MVCFEFTYFIYTIKKWYNMRKKVKNKKVSMSITLDPEVYKFVDENFSNKSAILYYYDDCAKIIKKE